MLAFTKTVTKTGVLRQLRAHAKADELVQGYGYWADGKGCAVGCTIHSGKHIEYEIRFGIPLVLARLEDQIFEGLPVVRARKWPIQFIQAVPEGADLSRVSWWFLHWLLTDNAVNPGINHPLVCNAIRQCADVLVPLTKGKPANKGAVRNAVWSADGAAQSAHAANAAWSAAMSAESAERAAMSAGYASNAVLMANTVAYAVETAADGAPRSMVARYVLMADKMLALLKAAPIGKALARR